LPRIAWRSADTGKKEVRLQYAKQLFVLSAQPRRPATGFPYPVKALLAICRKDSSTTWAGSFEPVLRRYPAPV
jgi:hypothetical protein